MGKAVEQPSKSRAPYLIVCTHQFTPKTMDQKYPPITREQGPHKNESIPGFHASLIQAGMKLSIDLRGGKRRRNPLGT